MINFKIPQSPQTFLYSSIGGTDTSIRLAPFPQDLDGNNLTMDDFGTFGTATIDPKIANFEEIIGFAGLVDNGDNTCTLTGVTRDLQSVYPYTGTGVGNQHGSSATVVFGINPQTLSQFPSRNNDEIIPANWNFTGTTTFANFPITPGNPPATATVSGIAKTTVNAYVADTGSASAFVLTPSPAIAAYVLGQIFTFKVANTNTGVTTVNISGLGAITVKKNGSNDLVAGDVVSGQIIEIEFDGTNFQLLSPAFIEPVNVQAFTGGGIFTVTIATPGVFSLAAHGFSIGSPVVLSTTGALPTGLVAGTIYYVIATNFSSGTFELSATPGGSAINTSGTQSGVHTVSFIWTKPAGAKTVTVIAVGGGGGGMGSSVSASSAGGGGAAASIQSFDASLVSATEKVSVGQSGVGGNNAVGTDGTASTFGTIVRVSAGPGKGGASSSTSAPGGSVGPFAAASGNQVGGFGSTTLNAEWGGGASSATAAANSGSSVYGAGAGGAGGGSGPTAGSNGGTSGAYTVGGGGSGGTTTAANGPDNSAIGKGYGGAGGGGAATGNGGNGGFPGGGGGGAYQGIAGNGSAGKITVITYF